jgi:hypothetical protein
LYLSGQGSKREKEAAEARAKKAASNTSDDKRDPKLPTSVPLPKDVSQVSNKHVATLLAEGDAHVPDLATPSSCSRSADGRGDVTETFAVDGANVNAVPASPPQPPQPPPPQQCRRWRPSSRRHSSPSSPSSQSNQSSHNKRRRRTSGPL